MKRWPLLAALLLLPLWAQDEGEWDESGEFIKPPPPGAQRATPTTLEGLLKGIKSDRLRPYVGRLGEVLKTAGRGDYARARDQARELAGRVSSIAVTQDDLPARATLAALYEVAQAEAEALLGDGRQAIDRLKRVERSEVPKDLRAEAALRQGYIELLDYDPTAAVADERRAQRLAREAVQPVIDAAAQLLRGQAAAALTELKKLRAYKPQGGQALLYATAAALTLERQAEARNYYGRPETAPEVGHLPLYYAVGGLLEAANGSLEGARRKFAEGARREHGRFRLNSVLLPTADLALGRGAAAAQALQQASVYAPGTVRQLAVELAGAPTAGRAQEALQTPRYWLTLQGYRAGEIGRFVAKAPAAAPPATTAPVSPAGELPTIQPPEGPLPPGAPETPASSETPAAAAEETGVEVRTLSTQAANAYQAALRLLAANQLIEAEATLGAAVRMRSFAEAWLALGQVRFLRGNLAGADEAFTAAVGLRPTWAEALYSLAQVREQLGEPADAAQLYRAALENQLAEPLAAYARDRLARGQ